MSRMMPVVRREYLERVRSKAFVISTVLGPLIMAGLILVPAFVMSKQRGRALRVTVLDATGHLRERIETSLLERRSSGAARFAFVPPPAGDPAEVQKSLHAAVQEDELDAYLMLPADVLKTSRVEYHGKNVSNGQDIQLLNDAITESLMASRLAARGLPTDQVKELTRKVNLRTIRLGATGSREDRGQIIAMSILLTMTLYSAILLWGAAIMNGVLEEKTNRVVEVVASSISPQALFAGKLLGVGGAGITQFLVWGLSLLAFGAYASMMGGSQVPELPPLVAIAFVVYFVLGFFLYGALYGALGASVNTQQEAQALTFPLVMPLVLATMFSPAVLSRPDSTLSVVLSFIPLFTPLIMLLRIVALTPPWWQIALSVVLMLASIAAVNAAAARIYRVGILMYGKRPNLPEILRWARSA
jgi:ABC-2 type transport system permease protein